MTPSTTRFCCASSILLPDAYRTAKSLLETSLPLLVTGIMEMNAERGERVTRL
jgi:hypothetical protein